MFNNYLYIMESRSGVFKIGISHDPQKRLATLKTAAPEPISLLFSIGVPSEQTSRALESQLHSALGEHRSNGEWFKVDKERLSIALSDVLSNPAFLESCHKQTPNGPANKTEVDRAERIERYLASTPGHMAAYATLRGHLGIGKDLLNGAIRALLAASPGKFKIVRAPGDRRRRALVMLPLTCLEDI